ncbi:DUF975 family protein [Tissierella creatinini]|nr:DUF975 family protein [Tissierella creatinini]TJX63053.1 DUF975 family protein [Soehngenia saccharolytica]
MWTRAELKNYAKDFLRKNYWKAFVVCLIFSILTGGGSNGDDKEYRLNDSDLRPSIEEQFHMDNKILDQVGSGGFREAIRSIGFFPAFFIGSTVFAFILILWILSLFISPLLTVGKNRFFLKGFEGDVNIRYLFSTFNRSEFWGIFKCIFITGIKNFLWFLLFIIPGIVKSYEYRMVPYLLVNDTDLTSREAIEMSRSLTGGHKWNMFVLDLSFIGWYLLGVLLFGIGVFFVTPYHEATLARLYNVLAGNDKNSDDDHSIVYE